MIKNPLVSVIIPCYNHEKFLDDCLESILAQTYENIELLICDDCSPDNSYQKILSYKEKLEKRFNNVVILQNEKNCGITKNVNRMLKLAKGEFVKTIASDDALAPDAIAEMVAFLQENPNISAVVSNGIRVSESEKYPNFNSCGRLYNDAPNFNKEGFLERVALENNISAPATMLRSSVYEKYGLYDETVKVEDFEYWLRVLKANEVEFAFLDKDLVFYRINENSMSSLARNSGLERRSRVMLRSEIESLNKYKEYLKGDVYAEAVLQRLISARWLAISFGFLEYNKELENGWKTFFRTNSVPFKKAINFKLFYFKLSIKKYIKKIIKK